MIDRMIISVSDDTLYTKFWKLYIDAFPKEERRSMAYQIKTMPLSNYHLEALTKEGQFIGFIGWWNFGEVCYIEHFATIAEVRGSGYGREALERFISDRSQCIVLEVEHPSNEIATRRIGFYQRIGLKLNDFEYAHPPYHLEQTEPVSLLIMSYPQQISEDQFKRFKDQCFDQVHFIHKKGDK